MAKVLRDQNNSFGDQTSVVFTLECHVKRFPKLKCHHQHGYKVVLLEKLQSRISVVASLTARAMAISPLRCIPYSLRHRKAKAKHGQNMAKWSCTDSGLKDPRSCYAKAQVLRPISASRCGPSFLARVARKPLQADRIMMAVYP